MQPPDPYPESIAGETLLNLPLRSYEGPIQFIHRDDDVPAAVRALAHERILGFDIETKPAFRPGESYPPALLQLAGAHGAWVFQLSQLENIGELYHLLGLAHVVKAGIALRDDVKKLRERRDFHPAGFVEISELSRAVGIKQTGLRPLAAILFGFRVSKREQRSNWGRRELTESQIRYAATDAWVSRELYLRLKTLVSELAREQPHPPAAHPPRPEHGPRHPHA